MEESLVRELIDPRSPLNVESLLVSEKEDHFTFAPLCGILRRKKFSQGHFLTGYVRETFEKLHFSKGFDIIFLKLKIEFDIFFSFSSHSILCKFKKKYIHIPGCTDVRRAIW